MNCDNARELLLCNMQAYCGIRVSGTQMQTFRRKGGWVAMQHRSGQSREHRSAAPNQVTLEALDYRKRARIG